MAYLGLYFSKSWLPFNFILHLKNTLNLILLADHSKMQTKQNTPFNSTDYLLNGTKIMLDFFNILLTHPMHQHNVDRIYGKFD